MKFSNWESFTNWKKNTFRISGEVVRIKVIAVITVITVITAVSCITFSLMDINDE